MATIRRRDLRLVLDDGAIRKILNSAPVKEALESEAGKVAARAKSSAPRESGEYAAGIRVETVEGKSRARSRVVASAPHSTVIESRTGNLRRAGS